jgi:predicted MPP superfamily phosphohydrolase
MNIIRIVFLVVITVTTFSISILTAKIYALGFRVSPHTNKILIAIGAIAPLLFILTMFFDRSTKNPLSYPVNALGGIIFYLFITGIILGIVLLIGKTIGNTVPTYISAMFLSLGFLMGIAGLIQAKFIKTTSYTINLAGAPAEWNNKTAVLVSDTHFGLINHKNFSDKVVSKILEINPDFVLHAGDFYDGPKNNTALITESWKNLANKIPVFYAPGNHEEYGDYAGFLTSIKNAGVTTLVDSVTNYEGVQIAGISYRDKNQIQASDLALRNLVLNKSLPTILINHPPTFQKTVSEIGVDLMVSGHTHKGQFWPLNFIVKRIYGKYIYGMNKDGDLITITTSGVGTAGPPLRLFNTPELVLIKFTTN